MKWRIGIVLLASMTAAGSVAPAGEPSSGLSREQVKKASEAAKKRLPPVDKVAAKKCQEIADSLRPDGAPADRAEKMTRAAACYRSAGSLGVAISLWTRLKNRHPGSSQAREASGRLGPAYEKAGMFQRAADAYFEHARRYGRDPGAPKDLLRGVCIWAQLGDRRKVLRGLRLLRRLQSKEIEVAGLCDEVQPIKVPKVGFRGSTATCDELARHVAPYSGGLRKDLVRKCETLRFSERDRRCLQRAQSRDAARRCFERIQSLPEAVATICNVPKRLARELAGKDAAAKAVLVGEYLSARIVHPRVVRLMARMAGMRMDEKDRAMRDLVKEAKLRSCPFVD